MSRRKSKTDDPKASQSASETGFHIERYHNSRNFALYDGPDLLAVTVYRKGAQAILERLEADARTIADLAAQVQALTPRFREHATAIYRPPEQLPLLAAEDLAAYRVTLPAPGMTQ